jgi:hypothetical protein
MGLFPFFTLYKLHVTSYSHDNFHGCVHHKYDEPKIQWSLLYYYWYSRLLRVIRKRSLHMAYFAMHTDQNWKFAENDIITNDNSPSQWWIGLARVARNDNPLICLPSGRFQYLSNSGHEYKEITSKVYDLILCQNGWQQSLMSAYSPISCHNDWYGNLDFSNKAKTT